MNQPFYTPDKICRLIDSYDGDPFFTQKYKAILLAQMDKGLDIFAHQGKGGAALLRITALLYAQDQYISHIFHLAQATRLICWFNETYTVSQAECLQTILQMTCRKIETLHDERDIWKNPALCARALRQIEREYQDINLSRLSIRLNVNSAYLSRVLSQSLKVSFLDLLHCKRILAATDSFLHTEKRLPLEQLAANLGYSSAHYLYCIFKKYVGLTPTECRHLMKQ